MNDADECDAIISLNVLTLLLKRRTMKKNMLADAMGIPHSTLSHLLNRDARPKRWTAFELVRAAEVLEVPIERLLKPE